jgi:DNA-binding transcriptional regulator YiaG
MTKEEIRATREKLRYSRVEMAYRLRVSVETIGKWESGYCKPNRQNELKIKDLKKKPN